MRQAVPAVPLIGFACAPRMTPNRLGQCQQKPKADPLWVSGSEAGNEELLACTYDTYGGVILEASCIPHAPDKFRHSMRKSLAKWRADGRSGVWIELSIADAALIPVATAEFGFEFHSAEKDRLMLKLWLPNDRPNSLPEGASHTVGIGAVVIDEATQKMLLLREKSGPAARLGIWKLPTGLVDAGEELHEAAVREVMEETGIETEFVHIGAFRTAHLGNLAHKGKTNLFFVARLRCKDGASMNPLCPKEDEVAEVRWFTMEEYEALPFPEKGTLYDLLNRSVLQSGARLVASQQVLGNNRKGTNWLYSPEAPTAAKF